MVHLSAELKCMQLNEHRYIPVNSLVLVCITLACLSVTAVRWGYDILLAVTAACFVNLDFLWVINLLITFK